jgi:hypothetical protein
MIFARYIGTDERFTTGKVYLVEPEIEDASNSNSTFSKFRSFIDVKDDSGVMVRLMDHTEEWYEESSFVKRWDFEFLEEVYAVVTKPFSDLMVGQVVVVVNVAVTTENKTGLLFSIKDKGFISSDVFVILDYTNVYPGVMVLDKTDGEWKKIRSVDECLWITVEGGDKRRSPEEFRFAIDRDGDIMIEPKVECIDAVGAQGLTKGNLYYIIRETMESDQRMLVVRSDWGREVGYFAGRFMA